MRGRRLLAAALVAVTATVGLAAQPAAAATEDASLVVAPDGGGIIRKDKALGVGVTVTNTGRDMLKAGRLTFSLDPAPVASTAALLNSIRTPPEQLQGYRAEATAAVPAIPVGGSRTVRATLSKEDLTTLLTSASGARRLYVQFREQNGATRVIAAAAVVKMAGGTTASVGFGTVLPLLAPEGTTGLVDAATQQQLAAPGGAWSRVLDAARADPTATIALDPAVLASVRLAGDAAPQDALDLLAQLDGLPNRFVELPYADQDLTLERAAGATAPMGPSGFAGVSFAAADQAAATPAPTATTGAEGPSTGSVTAWRWSDEEVAWPVPGTVRSADLGPLGGDGAVLLSSDDVADTTARRTAGPLARIGSTRVLVADSTASALLATASAGGTPGDAALSTLVGVLAAAAVSGETDAYLAAVGRGSDTAQLARVLSLLGDQPWIRGRDLPALLGADDPQGVRLKGGSVAPSRVATAKELLGGEREVRQLGKAITGDAGQVVDPQRLALLGVLSSSWRSDDTGWRAAAQTAEQAFSGVTGAVKLASGAESNAIGTDGTLRVRVTNDLPEPVVLTVRASASNGRLQFQDGSSTVTVPARAGNVAKIAYKSITNGSTVVTLRLQTADGVLLAQDQRDVAVQAGFDAVVAGILLGALALLLAIGVYRNITRRRSPRSAATA
ncbi:hypothetical protein D1781_01130 [Amnibacterium setariae]|uniref:Uncharacterized protein n=1 Tax=Amnibacterium setariae TaxID=2306585 RepID=A0A3A1TZN2_9MICO|nr:hypothetical protein D1781_01130 [Amnibacterium setariae]